MADRTIHIRSGMQYEMHGFAWKITSVAANKLGVRKYKDISVQPNRNVTADEQFIDNESELEAIRVACENYLD